MTTIYPLERRYCACQGKTVVALITTLCEGESQTRRDFAGLGCIHNTRRGAYDDSKSFDTANIVSRAA